MLFAVTGPEWIQITTLITACITVVVSSVVGAYLAIKTSELKQQQESASQKQDLADQKLSKIEIHTNSLTTRLEEAARVAGEAMGVDKEKARVAAEAALVALGALAEQQKKSDVPASVPSIVSDIQIVKTDVKEVKRDVKKGFSE